MMINHYVYKLTDKITGEFYFGSRTCECNIDQDNYMSSMTTWKPNKNNLIKEIIKDDFKSRSEAIVFESQLIKKNINSKLNRNYHIPNKGFHVQGLKKPNHPFKTNKSMKKWCKYFNIKCNTNDGSDINWDKLDWLHMDIGSTLPTNNIPKNIKQKYVCNIKIAKCIESKI